MRPAAVNVRPSSELRPAHSGLSYINNRLRVQHTPPHALLSSPCLLLTAQQSPPIHLLTHSHLLLSTSRRLLVLTAPPPPPHRVRPHRAAWCVWGHGKAVLPARGQECGTRRASRRRPLPSQIRPARGPEHAARRAAAMARRARSGAPGVRAGGSPYPLRSGRRELRGGSMRRRVHGSGGLHPAVAARMRYTRI